MRRVTIVDLVAGATLLRELGGSPANQRRWADAICAVAGMADRRRAKLGRAHPLLGDGSFTGLAAGLGAFGPKPPTCSDDGFLTALSALSYAVARRMRKEPKAT